MEADVPLIVAECGTHYSSPRHDRRLENALFYADLAKDCGADYVKYQIFTEGELFCPLPGDEKRQRRWKNCHLDYNDWFKVKNHCETIGIGFMASAFQYETVDWLVALNVDYIKVASRAVRDFPYERVKGFKLIMSDGMYPLPHHVNGFKLQCVSEYPSLTRWTRHDGLSDHSGTPWPAIDALARGARVIEVHLSFNKWDHDRESSVKPHELSLICDARDNFAQMRAGEHRHGFKVINREVTFHK